jgi:hypothetical protein
MQQDRRGPLGRGGEYAAEFDAVGCQRGDVESQRHLVELTGGAPADAVEDAGGKSGEALSARGSRRNGGAEELGAHPAAVPVASRGAGHEADCIRLGAVSGVRLCSKVKCGSSATWTLTYVHADACVVIGPLAMRAEPGAHDLCSFHAERLTAPQGWELIRLGGGEAATERSRDDLLAIADAVREAAKPKVPPNDRPHGHLRVVGDPDE